MAFISVQGRAITLVMCKSLITPDQYHHSPNLSSFGLIWAHFLWDEMDWNEYLHTLNTPRGNQGHTVLSAVRPPTRPQIYTATRKEHMLAFWSQCSSQPTSMITYARRQRSNLEEMNSLKQVKDCSTGVKHVLLSNDFIRLRSSISNLHVNLSCWP